MLVECEIRLLISDDKYGAWEVDSLKHGLPVFSAEVDF